MPHTSEIEKALDDLIIDEAGMKFQVLAVVLAKQKWPRLIACERKKYLGLDAYASRELEPDGNGFGLVLANPGIRKDRCGRDEGEEEFPRCPRSCNCHRGQGLELSSKVPSGSLVWRPRLLS